MHRFHSFGIYRYIYSGYCDSLHQRTLVIFELSRIISNSLVFRDIKNVTCFNNTYIWSSFWFNIILLKSKCNVIKLTVKMNFEKDDYMIHYPKTACIQEICLSKRKLLMMSFRKWYLKRWNKPPFVLVFWNCLLACLFTNFDFGTSFLPIIHNRIKTNDSDC